MGLMLHVRDFGKIKKADVDIHNYTLFIGDNNSGKSYLMQLISCLDQEFAQCASEIDFIFDTFENEKNYVLTKERLIQFLDDINHQFNEKKEEIAKKIFKKNIAWGKVWISNDTILDFKTKIYSCKYHEHIMDLNGVRIYTTQPATYINRSIFFTCVHHIKRQNLYFPSARSGLLLLYRDFFAESVDRVMMDEVDKKTYGLTLPVYNFLRFLQTYSYSEDMVEYNKTLLDFLSQYLLEGSLAVGINNQIFYTPKGRKEATPLYLSSAMINELTPIWMSLTNERMRNFLLIDEIETSLHPKKQMQFVRLLNRMNNQGYRIIASTHSDTTAAAINNLMILSERKKQGQDVSEILKEIGYQEEDLLLHEGVKVYQFQNEDSYSLVKEVKFQYPVGFQFDTFDDALDVLIYNTKNILEG